jgi:hypothetical protein
VNRSLSNWVIKLLAFVASVEFIVSIESRTSSKLKTPVLMRKYVNAFIVGSVNLCERLFGLLGLSD